MPRQRWRWRGRGRPGLTKMLFLFFFCACVSVLFFSFVLGGKWGEGDRGDTSTITAQAGSEVGDGYTWRKRLLFLACEGQRHAAAAIALRAACSGISSN